MNEKTKQRLESEINVPAPTQPVDKLRIDESPAASASAGTRVGWFLKIENPFNCCGPLCFADDE